MRKHNGSPLPPQWTLPLRDGISIVAAGEGEIPTEVRVIVKVPNQQYAPCVIFSNSELLGDVIEQLIAYRRYVFPDAPEVDTHATLDDIKETDE